MITCAECLERCLPDDPRVPVGRYKQSGCDYYCSKPAYDRELEAKCEQPREQVLVHRLSSMNKLENDILQQLSRQVKSLQAKVDGLTTKKKKYIKYN